MAPASHVRERARRDRGPVRAAGSHLLRAARVSGRRGLPCSRRTDRRPKGAAGAGFLRSSRADASSNTELRERSSVVVGIRFALQLRDQSIVVPDFEVVVVAEDVDIAGHGCRLAKANGDKRAALRVQLAGLTVVVDAIKETEP